MHLLRHPQIHMALFPEHFPPDHIAELKCDHFTVDSLNGLKQWWPYLKASTNEMIYSDYLQAVREAEKEEAMEPSYSQMDDNATKPKAMSFFSLQKLKGTQPVKTPAVWVVHFKEDGVDKERGVRVMTPMESRA